MILLMHGYFWAYPYFTAHNSYPHLWVSVTHGFEPKNTNVGKIPCNMVTGYPNTVMWVLVIHAHTLTMGMSINVGIKIHTHICTHMNHTHRPGRLMWPQSGLVLGPFALISISPGVFKTPGPISGPVHPN